LEELEMMRDLFARHGYPRALEEYQWQYLDLPTKECFVQFVVDEGMPVKRLAAVVACFALRFKLGDEEGLGVQTNNIMTDKHYRGQGLFVSSVVETLKYFKTRELDFAYGFGNSRSGPFYIDTLGWKNLNPVPLLIKPLRANYFIERMGLPSWMTRKLPTLALTRYSPIKLGGQQRLNRELRFDRSFDGLWEIVSKEICVAVQRDRSFLNWRFAARPGSNYRMLSVRAGDDLLAYVVYGHQQKHGGCIGYILEYLHHPAHEEAGRVLLREAGDELRRAGCDAILAWSYDHGPNYTSFRECNFFPLPEKLRPTRVFMVSEPMTKGAARLTTERTNWYVSFADLDVV
jgi:hypothetical protein